MCFARVSWFHLHGTELHPQLAIVQTVSIHGDGFLERSFLDQNSGSIWSFLRIPGGSLQYGNSLYSEKACKYEMHLCQKYDIWLHCAHCLKLSSVILSFSRTNVEQSLQSSVSSVLQATEAFQPFFSSNKKQLVQAWLTGVTQFIPIIQCHICRFLDVLPVSYHLTCLWICYLNFLIDPSTPSIGIVTLLSTIWKKKGEIKPMAMHQSRWKRHVGKELIRDDEFRDAWREKELWPVKMGPFLREFPAGCDTLLTVCRSNDGERTQRTMPPCAHNSHPAISYGPQEMDHSAWTFLRCADEFQPLLSWPPTLIIQRVLVVGITPCPSFQHSFITCGSNPGLLVPAHGLSGKSSIGHEKGDHDCRQTGCRFAQRHDRVAAPMILSMISTSLS